MAIAVIGGLVTSTVLSLVVVPVVYTLLPDVEAFPRRFRRPKDSAAAKASRELMPVERRPAVFPSGCAEHTPPEPSIMSSTRSVAGGARTDPAFRGRTNTDGSSSCSGYRKREPVLTRSYCPLTSSVNTSSDQARPIALSRRLCSAAKLSPSRRTSIASQLLPSAAVATQANGGKAPTVMSPPSSISNSMFFIGASDAAAIRYAAARLRRKALHDVLQVRMWLVTVQARRVDQAHDRGGALPAARRHA